MNDEQTRSYSVNIRHLCFLMTQRVSAYYKTNQDKFDFFKFTIIDLDKHFKAITKHQNSNT